ncbi:MAG: hypothetical protein AB4426_15925 [Xenococcaceae cyanobacterium]
MKLCFREFALNFEQDGWMINLVSAEDVDSKSRQPIASSDIAVKG